MAYDSSTGIITAPVDMGDISTALGVDSLDLGTLCESEEVNMLSKYKPTDYAQPEGGDSFMYGDGSKNGYFLGYDCYGIQKPYLTNTQFVLLGNAGTPSGEASKLTGIQMGGIVGDWQKSPLVWHRQLDFDGYCHVPANNRFTNGVNPFAVSMSVLNPNGGISASAQMRYNWDDIVHSDGKATTLGLKSLLACDGVNDKAYLGVAVYRTLTKTPNTGVALTPLCVAAIHTAPLGETCPNTGLIEMHNVAFDFSASGLISGYESSVTSGYANFYIGETGIKAVPFIAKWSGSQWCFVGLGVTPYSFPGSLVASGGAGSTKNTVVISKVVCRLRAVQNTDGSITMGIASNSDFAVTVSGSGFLAFRKDNAFYITPADGNSTMSSQSSVRLGISDDTTLDLPGTTVSARTYYASSLMYGRTSSANYLSAPSSTFKPNGTIKFKVGISIPYYQKLTTWVYLNGSVEVDPADLQSYYTITITP